jgi:hypothetical protein
MDSTETAAAWKRAFGDAVPLGHVCRRMIAERWVRIHSLPESKRYPEDEDDFRELLSRHNAVATAVLGEGERFVLFDARFGDDTVSFGTCPVSNRRRSQKCRNSRTGRMRIPKAS